MNNLPPQPRTFPALSVWHPYAGLISGKMKQFETRSWSTRHRGLLYLHASKRWTEDEKDVAHRFCAYYPGAREAIFSTGRSTPPLGCIIARCELVDCIPVEKLWNTLTEQERAFGDYSAGRFAWQLEVLALPPEPVLAKGAQAIFRWQP